MQAPTFGRTHSHEGAQSEHAWPSSSELKEHMSGAVCPCPLGPVGLRPLPVPERSRPDKADGWTPAAGEGTRWGWLCVRGGGCARYRVIRGNVFSRIGGDGHRVSRTLLIHYHWALLQVASCRHAEPECVVMWQFGVRERRLCTSVCVCECVWCAVIAALSLSCYRLSGEAELCSVPHFFPKLSLLLQGGFRPADSETPALFWGGLWRVPACWMGFISDFLWWTHLL